MALDTQTGSARKAPAHRALGPRIYPSLVPPVKINECSVFTLVFPKDYPYENHTPAFVDAETKFVLTLGDLRKKCLELAWGVRSVLHSEYGGPQLKRGDTVLFFR